jgi:hypothetical protein
MSHKTAAAIVSAAALVLSLGMVVANASASPSALCNKLLGSGQMSRGGSVVDLERASRRRSALRRGPRNIT